MNGLITTQKSKFKRNAVKFLVRSGKKTNLHHSVGKLFRKNPFPVTRHIRIMIKYLCARPQRLSDFPSSKAAALIRNLVIVNN